jgi:hypothetical protein
MHEKYASAQGKSLQLLETDLVNFASRKQFPGQCREKTAAPERAEARPLG